MAMHRIYECFEDTLQYFEYITNCIVVYFFFTKVCFTSNIDYNGIYDANTSMYIVIK